MSRVVLKLQKDNLLSRTGIHKNRRITCTLWSNPGAIVNTHLPSLQNGEVRRLYESK